MIEITMERFYKVGIFCFIVIGVMNFINFFYYFNSTNIFSKIGTLSGIVFNFIIVGFFFYLLKSLPKQTIEEGSLDKELQGGYYG